MLIPLASQSFDWSFSHLYFVVFTSSSPVNLIVAEIYWGSQTSGNRKEPYLEIKEDMATSPTKLTGTFGLSCLCILAQTFWEPNDDWQKNFKRIMHHFVSYSNRNSKMIKIILYCNISFTQNKCINWIPPMQCALLQFAWPVSILNNISIFEK